MSFNTFTRSLFEAVYVWLQEQPPGVYVGCLSPDAWFELFVAACLLGEMDTDLNAEYCTRVECYDASPGGHGRAWTQLNHATVVRVARLADTKFPYTNLSLRYGVELTSAGKCPRSLCYLNLATGLKLLAQVATRTSPSRRRKLSAGAWHRA